MSPTGAGLGYDAAPPLSTPLRFFLTAPLFGIAAGVMLMLAPELLESRWTPGARAITHLMTVGFMLMVMVGERGSRAVDGGRDGVGGRTVYAVP